VIRPSATLAVKVAPDPGMEPIAECDHLHAWKIQFHSSLPDSNRTGRPRGTSPATCVQNSVIAASSKPTEVQSQGVAPTARHIATNSAGVCRLDAQGEARRPSPSVTGAARRKSAPGDRPSAPRSFQYRAVTKALGTPGSGRTDMRTPSHGPPFAA
jgi:hypothetical protein